MRNTKVGLLLGRTIISGGVLRSCAQLLLVCSFVVFFVKGAGGAIPTAERTVLLNIYTSTNGSGWATSTNWNGDAGTECTWYGVTCDAGANHVTRIDLSFNNLVGYLPELASLTNLYYFDVSFNQLTGSIPSLSGLTNLQYFYVYYNELTGSIPSLSGLTNLIYFDVDTNQLTGSIPSLSGLASLENFYVYDNLLTGDVPAVPSPNNLLPDGSLLCPNHLNLTSNSAWDTATGSSPWYTDCITYSVTYDSNGNTGGSVPVDESTYYVTQVVTVLGNTGALYKTGFSFVGWNTLANGTGPTYVGGDTFSMGPADVVFYAQWTTPSGLPVRIAETLADYTDIQSAYNDAQDGQTIQAQDGLGSQSPLLFDNPAIVSFKLSGGYNAYPPLLTFTTDTGATLVIGNIVISRGSVEIEKIIIQ